MVKKDTKRNIRIKSRDTSIDFTSIEKRKKKLLAKKSEQEALALKLSSQKKFKNEYEKLHKKVSRLRFYIKNINFKLYYFLKNFQV